MSAGARRAADIAPALALLVACAAFVAAHAPFFSPAQFLGPDEGYLGAFAWRLREGRFLPYVDAASHRGPLLYWLTAAATAAAPDGSWLPIRLLALVTTLVTTVATFLAARRAGLALAGGVAVLLLPPVAVGWMGSMDALGLNGEWVQAAFAMGSLGVLVRGLGPPEARPRPGFLALAGALVSAGALAKQVGVVAIPPLFLWTLVAATRPCVGPRERWRGPLAFIVGAALPVVVVLAIYAAAGALADLVYWTFTYNRDVYLSPFPPGTRLAAAWTIARSQLHWMAPLVALALAALAGVARSAKHEGGLARAVDRHGFVAVVALGLLAALVGALSALRGFPHYYVQPLPWGALLVGLALEGALRAATRWRPTLQAALAAGLLGVMAPLSLLPVWQLRTEVERARAAGQLGDPSDGPICRAIHALARPDEPIFVWGFRGDLYVSCLRRPASRFVYTTLVAGVVVPDYSTTLAQEDARAVPGSRAQLLAELETAKPPVVVDAPLMLGGRTMRRYPVLRAWLDASYCALGRVEGLEVFARRRADGSCPTLP